MKIILVLATIALALPACTSGPARNTNLAHAPGCDAPAQAPSLFNDADAAARRSASLNCGGGGSASRQARDFALANQRNTPAEQARIDARLAEQIPKR